MVKRDDNDARLLRRRVLAGNLLGYAGLLGGVVIYLRDAPTHPFWYAVTGGAVVTGVGLAWLYLLKLR